MSTNRPGFDEDLAQPPGRRYDHVKIVNESEYPLRRASASASGYDLHNAFGPVWLQPGQRNRVPTGIRLQMAHPSMEAQIRPRSSSLFNRGILVDVGTIDQDYTGPLFVSVMNVGVDPVLIARGERVAQLVFGSVKHPSFEVVESLAATQRGEAGFGSTGMRAMAGEPSDEHGHPLPTPGPLLQQRIDAPKTPATSGPSMFRDAVTKADLDAAKFREETRADMDRIFREVVKAHAEGKAVSYHVEVGSRVAVADPAPEPDPRERLAAETASLIKSRCSDEGGRCHCDTIRKELNEDLDARRVGIR